MDTIDRIIRLLPHDLVLLCPCGAPILYAEVVRGIAKCSECGTEHNYHSLETATMSEYVEKCLKNLTNRK